MRGINYNQPFVYLNDLVIFDRLRKINLKLNPLKWELLQTEIAHLGHKITSQGIIPDPSEVETLNKYPVPRNADDVIRFVAFANYCRHFYFTICQSSTSVESILRKIGVSKCLREIMKYFDTTASSGVYWFL